MTASHAEHDSPAPASVEDVQGLLRDQAYITDRGLAIAIFLALKLRRPLFLEGEAGVGKTEIARALADGPRIPTSSACSATRAWTSTTRYTNGTTPVSCWKSA